MLKGEEREFKMYEFDSRVGLNGQKCFWKFPCLLNSSDKRFFVWMGEVSTSKFTKSTFMNLVDFAESNQASEVVLVQNREHPEKSKFKTLFKVLDANRISSKKLGNYIDPEKLHEAAEKCAFYAIGL